MKILVIGHSGLIETNRVNRLRRNGHAAACAALVAAVCISAAPADDAADSTLRTRAAVDAIAPQAVVPLLIDRSATAMGVARRAPSAPADAAQRVHPERGLRALLRAIQTIFHLARTACVAMADCLSLASLSLASREALTVRANGSDAASAPWHAV